MAKSKKEINEEVIVEGFKRYVRTIVDENRELSDDELANIKIDKYLEIKNNNE